MKQITGVLIGAGLRGGHVYASYALEHPEEFRIVAVAEPDERRRKQVCELHKIPQEHQYESYEQLLKEPCMADCALVCTQDNMHYEPVKMALERGYHVLCEKPMSPVKEEIISMGKLAEQYDRVLAICHVLRYSSFYTKIKELLDTGTIGQLMSIQSMESVGFWHHAHSFVRGNWRNAQMSSPMILQKCCHDMDILLWLAGSECKKISSFGKLTFFTEEHAPEGAPERCLDGCPHRDNCAFYAPRFYLEHPKAETDGLVYAVAPSNEKQEVLQALQTGPYGRCVFHCDNTVVDHQVVNLEFENQVAASFVMSAFTKDCKRTITLMGTEGELQGDMEEGWIRILDFVSGNTEEILLHTPAKGHSGSDERIMRDFVRLLEGEAHTKSLTGAGISVDSHLMALAAEESRLTGKTIDFTEYKRGEE